MKKLIVLIVVWAGVAGAQPAQDPAVLRKTCVDALNTNPDLAKQIAATFDRRIDQETINAHEEAAKRIQRNESHVYLAYAAMWVIAALFVGFLWFRQQALKAEIARLRRDLDATGDKA